MKVVILWDFIVARLAREMKRGEINFLFIDNLCMFVIHRFSVVEAEFGEKVNVGRGSEERTSAGEKAYATFDVVGDHRRESVQENRLDILEVTDTINEVRDNSEKSDKNKTTLVNEDVWSKEGINDDSVSMTEDEGEEGKRRYC